MVPGVVRRALLRVGATPQGRRLLRFYESRGLVGANGNGSHSDLERRRAGLPDNIVALVDAPTEMSLEERLFLYALVRGSSPRRVLEIGTSQGGSALTIASALEDNAGGTVYSIDPLPRIEIDPQLFHGRLSVVQGESPGAIHDAARAAGEPFDLILIDGIHIYEQTRLDLVVSLLYAADGAYILLHDAFHFGVSEAIRETVTDEPRLQDCGYVCNTPRPVGDLMTHAGFRLLRVGAAVTDVEPLVRPTWEAIGKQPPHDRALLNHDLYYCQYVEPCAHCR